MKKRFSGFWRGKGFYLALTLVIAGAATASFFAVNSMMTHFGTGDTQSRIDGEETTPWDTQSAQQAEKKQEDVPVSSSSSSASQSGASSQASSQASSAASSDAASAPASPSPSYVWPVEGEVTQSFTGDELVYNETMGDWRTHEGIDINAQLGAPVSACAKGTVTDVTTDDMMGVTVTVDHGSGMESIYSNLTESVNVQVGSAVEAGTVLGTVGTSAISESASPSHLHFALREYGVMIDPLNYLH